MPPFGLYPVPRHHLYGGMTPSARPVFNSMDFSDGTGTAEPADQQVDGTEEGDGKKRDKGENKDEKKKSKRRDKDRRSEGGEELSAAPAPSSSKIKKSKNKKKENSGIDARTSAKKRKRESEAHADTPTAVRGELTGANSFLDGAFLQGLKITMGDLGASFGPPVSAPLAPEKSSKKKKSSSKTEHETTKETTGEATSNGATNATPSGEGSAKKKRGRPRKDTLSQAVDTPKKAVVMSSAPSPYISTPKHTPIPLPQKSPARITSAVIEARQKHGKSERQDSRVLVSETPPSQMPRTSGGFVDTPIPFNIARPGMSSARKKAKKGPFVNISSPTTDEGGQTRISAPATLAKGANGVTNSQTSLNDTRRIQASLTPSNLLRYTQPLNDEPKPRPRGRSASVATSTGSSASSMSIIEAFARVNKPYSRSGAEIDPFVTPEKKKKKAHLEKHTEATVQDFTEKFKASQKTVNFADEQEYRDAYRKWREDNDAAGPPPCLNKATGCNPKREQLLRLSKEDSESSTLLSALVSSPGTNNSNNSIDTSNAVLQRTLTAESLLSLATTARIPIPLGSISGQWTLFCPSYAAAHIDKYNFGQRTLTISPIAGFKSSSGLYTARLSIPPRSMAYSTLSFSAPPHASFRATVLTTGVEGYTVQVVFLGNGYLTLRADLGLLLTGKKGEVGKSGGIMEFVGVRDGGGVCWEGDENEDLEVVGRRLCAKYDGED